MASPARGIQNTPIRSAASRSSTGSPSDPHGQARFIPGAVIDGRYRIIGLLGRGGMGEVYRGDDLKLGQPVALKFLPESLASDPDRLDRFYNEVRISRQVTHSNVCRVYDIGEFDGYPFISMEYIDGEDLSSLLKRIGRLPKEKAIQIARQICAGLASAHDKGILHRDLKPANILIDGRGHAHITDFGLAGLAHELVGNEVRAGTPAYMAPEQLAGTEVTHRSDIYSLGLTLYELFTGKAAFEARTTQELMRLQSNTTPTSPAEYIEGFDPAVEALILRCLERDPMRRPGSALTVSASLPGGDPLQAALAAGETPSPAMVADAGSDDLLRPGIALGLLCVVLFGLVAQVFIGKGGHLIHRIPSPKPPAVLEADAERLIEDFGYASEALDSEAGFLTLGDSLQQFNDNAIGLDRWDKVKEMRPSPLQFWYRQSPGILVPANGRGNVSSEDPPISVSGMINVGLDLAGRLTFFKVVPPQVDEAPVDTEARPDWSKLFAAAGLEMASFESVAPTWNPDINCQSRDAWTGTYADQPDVPIRIEACGYGGKAAWFEILLPWSRASRMAGAERTEGSAERALKYFILGFILLLPLGAAFLAWRSLRLGRGDRKGGFRLAIYIFTLMFAADLLRRHHVAATSEFVLIADALAINLLITTIVWILYQGLEPYVRRLWPQLLITWTRLLSGRLTDPGIGRDILVAGAAFTAAILLRGANHAILQSLGFPSLPPAITSSFALMGGGGTLATWLLSIVNPLIGPLAVTFALLLLRVILKRTWLAMVVLGILFVVFISLATVSQLPEGTPSLPSYALTIMIFSLLDILLLFTIVSRFGYLAFVFMSAFSTPVNLFPLTPDLSNWYAVPSLLAILPLFALAFYGFHLARAGRPVLAGALDPDLAIR
jgi:serine/threonine-protein kinase